MTTIQRVLFAVIRTTTYPGLLAAEGGRLITRTGYTQVFDTLDGGALRLPWRVESGAPHWSQFWARYLGKPERIRQLTADAAFDRVVPFEWRHEATITGPQAAKAAARVLVYPSAIAVVVDVEVSGDWSLNDLAGAVAAVRAGKQWTLTIAGKTSKNRNLDGVATDLRDRAANLLTSGLPPEPGEQSVFTVAAPVSGQGDLAAFDLTDPTAAGCLVGLAALGPPGTLNEKHLLEANSNPLWGARIYALKTGHAIWHPRDLLAQSADDAITCLYWNQVDLVAQIAALSGVVAWAAERVGAPGGIPARIQPFVSRAAERLQLFDAGKEDKTYRSGLAPPRIAPLREQLQAVQSAI